jgi:predicted nucleotidyltransferase component of viral defense system
MHALALGEVFHLAFLRELVRAVPLSTFVLKGGSNLRFFFGSPRYSEDMDLDAMGMPVHLLRDKVMDIIASKALADTLRTFAVERIVPPRLSSAKQTETVQRFKVHLLTAANEDLSTKVEFSRRGFDASVRSEPVPVPVLARYRLAPLIVPHYAAGSAASQKVRALLGRRHTEARDIFDLYILSSRSSELSLASQFAASELKLARERVLSVEYEQYRDTVVSLLAKEDQRAHDSPGAWDEIRLRVEGLLGSGGVG